MRAQAMPGEDRENLQTPEEVAKKIINLVFLNKVNKGLRVNLIDV